MVFFCSTVSATCELRLSLGGNVNDGLIMKLTIALSLQVLMVSHVSLTEVAEVGI
jgi:hypothetical protein